MTVILLHSSGASPRQWSTFAERLAPWFTVATPALVGHGDNAPWAPGSRPSLAGEVESICAQVKPRGPVHLVGHSYGGAVAIKAALSGRLEVASLSVYEPSLFAFLRLRMGSYGESESPVRIAQQIDHALANARNDEAARIYVDYWSRDGAFAALSPEQRARVVGRMPVVADCFKALICDETTASHLHALRFPALVMFGARSPRPSQDIGELVASNLSHARLHRFSRLDHMGPMAAPHEVNPVIEEFLYEIDGACRPAASLRLSAA